VGSSPTRVHSNSLANAVGKGLKMTVAELIEELKQFDPTTPVCACDGYGDPAAVTKVEAAHAYPYPGYTTEKCLDAFGLDPSFTSEATVPYAFPIVFIDTLGR
jgi:hypothetical protein